MKTIPPRTWPTFAVELLRARAALTLADHVGLALRAHRRTLGMGQREYARHRGWSKGHICRLESGADTLRLGTVLEALDGTGYELALYRAHDDGTDGPPPSAPSDAVSVPDLEPVLDLTDGSAEPSTADGSVDRAPPPDRRGVLVRVGPEHWLRPELIASVPGGGRRFPAHHATRQVTGPPRWWFWAEATDIRSVAPQWYAPRPTEWDDLDELGA